MRKLFSLLAAVLFAGSMMAANFELFSGELVEGDYLITYDGGAMKASVASNRFEYAEITATADVVADPAANLVWHLAKVGDNWTIYNADQQKYAGSTNSKNQGALLDSATTDNAKWIVSGTATYEFANVARAAGSNPDNKWLRRNTTYGFACYASTTGGALTLYKMQSGEAPAVAKPAIAGEAFFYDSTEVAITCATEGASIYYTLDGTEPSAASTAYAAAFMLNATATVKAIAINGADLSAIAEKTFTKNPSFDSFEALVAAGLANNTLVEVAFADVLIDSIYVSKSSGKRQGVYFTVGETAYEIYYNKAEVPEAWEAGGMISGTIRGKWTLYSGIWELVPSAADWTWENLTYEAETPQPAGLKAVSDSTTWDFAKVKAKTTSPLYSSSKEGILLTAETTPSITDEVIYADYDTTVLTIAAGFDAEAIAFTGEYPIRKDKYCMNGAVHFKAAVAGNIIVKFSDTGTSASATAVKRYLMVNGDSTQYWTSRENNGAEAPYAAQLNVVTEAIPVPAGDVVLTGSSAICVYYVTFIPDEPAPAPTDEPAAAPAEPTWPANQVKAVYSAKYEADCGFGEWGSGTVYAQEAFGKKYVTTDLGYFGLLFEDNHLNCSNMEKLHLDVWIAQDTTIRIVPIIAGSAEPKNIYAHLEANKWNAIDIALADFENVPSWIDVYQIKIDEARNMTLWLNNVYFYTTQAPEEDPEAPQNFTAELAETSFFSVRVKANATDNSGTVKYQVINGELIVGSATGESGKDTYITVKDLTPNTDYSFKVVAKDESGNSTEPIELAAVKTLAAPAAAHAPTMAAENVVSLYSDAYTTATTYETLNQGWWMGPATMVEAELAENDHVLYYADFAEGGAFGWAFNTEVNAAGFQKLHLDIYPIEATSFVVWPVIQPEADYKTTTAELVANQWNEVIIDLTDKTFAPFKQFGWVINKEIPGFFVDNVYFFKDAQGFENIDASTKAVKVLHNGQIFILRGDKVYTITGQPVNMK